MAFTLLSIDNCEKEFCNCVVKHSDNELKVKIYGESSNIRLLVEKDIIVELGYDKIISHEILTVIDDNISGIKKLKESNHIIITGRIHNVIKAKDDFLLDIYIQDGAEFISVFLSELNIELPQIDSMIRIIVDELRLLPSKSTLINTNTDG